MTPPTKSSTTTKERERAKQKRLAEERQTRLNKLGYAIRTARTDVMMTQAQLGAALSPWVGEDIPQTSISRWETGMVSLDVEQIWAIEQALGIPAGTILIMAGYIPGRTVPRDIETMLRGDPSLDETLRDIAVAGYRQWVQTTRLLRDK